MVHVAIFDYGAGNIFSLKNSLERASAAVDVINDFNNIDKYSGLLLPGVGNFDPAMNSIQDMSSTFMDNVHDIPVLGICLGMEMFFESSQEGTEKGLCVMDGNVIVLPSNMKVPHMGWNNLKIISTSKILQNVNDNSWVYFVHSYMVKPVNHNVIMAESDYGIMIPAVVEYKNFIGTQFHPEKSGKVGRIIIENYVKMCTK